MTQSHALSSPLRPMMSNTGAELSESNEVLTQGIPESRDGVAVDGGLGLVGVARWG